MRVMETSATEVVEQESVRQELVCQESGHAKPETPAASTNGSATAGIGLMAALSLALSACGGGGSSGGSSSGGSSGGSGGVTPTPTPVITISDTEAARFLLQAQFATNTADIASVKSIGYDAWLTAQFNAGISQTGTAWLDSFGYNSPTTSDITFSLVPGDWMAWRMLMTGSDQLRKRAALALTEMMVSSLSALDGFWPDYMIAGYWDMLNANAFGNFRTLLEEVTLNPSVGTFLNTRGNLKEDTASGRQPDENYAREVMQLFTIGLYQLNTDGTLKTDSAGKPIETYTQSDITNLARVFTGYDLDLTRVTYSRPSWAGYNVPSNEMTRDRMKLTASNHSTLAATFLGVTIAANTDGATALRTALDTLFNHPNVGPFFARQMIQRLVTSNPSAGYISRVAQAFNNNGSGVRGDMKAFWRAILTDTEARALPTAATAGKMREPMIRFAQWARTFNIASTTGKWEIYDLSNSDWGLSQSPLRAPSVFNFFRPGYVPPNTAIADASLTAPEFQLHNESSTASYINFMLSMLINGYNDVKPDYSNLQTMVTDARQMVDWLNLYMTGNQLSAATVTTIVTALEAVTVTSASSASVKSDRIQAALILVMACPEYIIQK